jgi:integrase
LSDAIARLIRSGHRYPDVLTYTLAQLRAFLAAIDRDERDDLTAQFALLVTAQRGGSAEIKRLLKELTR